MPPVPTPPAYFDPAALTAFQAALAHLSQGFAGLPAYDPLPTDPAALEQVLLEVAERLRDNYPYFHPLYAGQMLKPPHPVARLAYMLALWINPNNHALDGGRASSHLEKEAVAQLARLFGWTTHLGHLTSGGTVANLEALCAEHQISPATFYKWKNEAEIEKNEDKRRLKELETENLRLKKMYAELQLKHEIVSEALGMAKKFAAHNKKMK